jgi:hypothetical protein
VSDEQHGTGVHLYGRLEPLNRSSPGNPSSLIVVAMQTSMLQPPPASISRCSASISRRAARSSEPTAVRRSNSDSCELPRHPARHEVADQLFRFVGKFLLEPGPVQR